MLQSDFVPHIFLNFKFKVTQNTWELILKGLGIQNLRNAYNSFWTFASFLRTERGTSTVFPVPTPGLAGFRTRISLGKTPRKKTHTRQGSGAPHQFRPVPLDPSFSPVCSRLSQPTLESSVSTRAAAWSVRGCARQMHPLDASLSPCWPWSSCQDLVQNGPAGGDSEVLNSLSSVFPLALTWPPLCLQRKLLHFVLSYPMQKWHQGSWLWRNVS